MTASNYFAYDNFLRTSKADEQYELPRNGLTVLPGLEIKYSRKGYVFHAQRDPWRAHSTGDRSGALHWLRLLRWLRFYIEVNPPLAGHLTVPASRKKAYTLYSGEFNKDYYIGKFTKGGWDMSNTLVEISWIVSPVTSRPFLSTPRMHGIPGGTDCF